MGDGEGTEEEIGKGRGSAYTPCVVPSNFSAVIAAMIVMDSAD